MSFLRRSSDPEQTRRFAVFMGAGRVAFGAVMVVAPRAFLVAARPPSEHQVSDSARLLTRMTGLRDMLSASTCSRTSTIAILCAPPRC